MILPYIRKRNITSGRMSSKELTVGQSSQYVGPYRLEKTLGKGQTGRSLLEDRTSARCTVRKHSYR